MLVKNVSRSAKVNILVLGHNSVDVTRKFFVSLYENTRIEDFILTFIDNGSTDGTYEFVNGTVGRLENINFYKSDINLGVIRGRNKAYEIASRYSDMEYVIILDNDQFVKENWLEEHIDYLEKNQYDIVGAEAWQMRKDFYPFKKIKNKNEYFTYVGCGGSLIKNCVIKDIGLFDEQFNPCYFEDPDFTFRAINAGYSVAWNPDMKIIHLPHQTLGNVKDKNQKFLESFMKFRKKWEGYNPKKLIL